MPEGTLQILGQGTSAVPLDVDITGNQLLDLISVKADYDGSAAGVDFVPMVEIISDAGVVMAQAKGPTVVAGDSATVTFFPFGAEESSTPAPTAGALTLIQKAVLVAPGTFNFTGFPATYNDLILVMILRSVSVATVDTVGLNVNGDVSNRYSFEYVRGNAGVASANGGNPLNPAEIGFIPAANGDANEYGFVETTFRGYSNTTLGRFKGGQSLSYCSRGVASFPDVFNWGWDWIQTTAITSIQITNLSGANFTTGSEARLYGLT